MECTSEDEGLLISEVVSEGLMIGCDCFKYQTLHTSTIVRASVSMR
jgi:hypothetical protein